jgi:hypothetical protein
MYPDKKHVYLMDYLYVNLESRGKEPLYITYIFGIYWIPQVFGLYLLNYRSPSEKE